jgi:hypothetical protein
MNKVASLPCLYTNMTQEQSMQQVYKWVQGEKENSLYICTKAFKSHPKRHGESSYLDHLMSQRSSTIELMFSNHVSIPTLKETKKTEPWIPKG